MGSIFVMHVVYVMALSQGTMYPFALCMLSSNAHDVVCLLVLWVIPFAVSLAHFRLLSTHIFVVTLAPFIELVYFSLLIEPSEEETYVQAESVIEEEQEPVYFAELGKPPSKNSLMSYYFTKHVLFSKIK